MAWNIKKKAKEKKKRKKHQAWNIRIIFIHIKSHHVPSFTYKHIHGWLKREKRKRWRERLERKRGISSSQLVMNKLSYQHQTLCANKSSKPTTQRQRAHSSIPLLTCHFPSTLTAWWWAKQLCPPLNIAHITHTSTYSQLRTFLFSLPSPASQNQAKRFLVLKARKKNTSQIGNSDSNYLACFPRPELRRHADQNALHRQLVTTWIFENYPLSSHLSLSSLFF